MASLLVGLFFALVGVDPTLGYARFSFGNAQLFGGVELHRGQRSVCLVFQKCLRSYGEPDKEQDRS